jgi:hypothetical protein
MAGWALPDPRREEAWKGGRMQHGARPSPSWTSLPLPCFFLPCFSSSSIPSSFQRACARHSFISLQTCLHATYLAYVHAALRGYVVVAHGRIQASCCVACLSPSRSHQQRQSAGLSARGERGGISARSLTCTRVDQKDWRDDRYGRPKRR